MYKGKAIIEKVVELYNISQSNGRFGEFSRGTFLLNTTC